MSDRNEVPKALADPQDPLPEANWLWRRVFTFVALAACFVLLMWLGYSIGRIVSNVVGRIDTMDSATVGKITIAALNTILTMFRLLFWIVIVVTTYYMVAPSAEQITKMIQTAGLLKHGIQIASRAKFEGPDGQREETQATVGQPPQPVVPPESAPTGANQAPGASEAPEAPESLPDAPWAAEEANQKDN